MIKILLVPYYKIYPLNSGGSVAQFGTIELLSKVCDITILVPEWYPLSVEEVAEIKALMPRVTIYSVNKSAPNIEVKKLSQNPLKRLLLASFKGLSWLKLLVKSKLISEPTITIKKTSEEEFSDVYSSNPFYLHSQAYIETLNYIIHHYHIDIVQLEFIENLSLVEALPSTVKKIFIQHECRFLRTKTHILAKQIQSSFTDYVFNFNKTIELALLKKFDAIVNFSSLDSDAIAGLLESSNQLPRIETIPFAVLEQDFQPLDTANYEPIHKLVFIGGEEHFPNKDAVDWFMEAVADKMFAQTGLQLHVIGKWNQSTIEKYQNDSSKVHFVGFVEDLSKALRNSICIAPVRIGAGLRTKILFAMAQGIPVVCTSFAVSGIGAKHSEAVMIADNPGAFVESVQFLVQNPDQMYTLSKNAQALVRQEYSQQKIAMARYALYQSILNI